MPLKSAKEVAIMTNTAITSLLYGDTYVQIPGRRPAESADDGDEQ